MCYRMFLAAKLSSIFTSSADYLGLNVFVQWNLPCINRTLLRQIQFQVRRYLKRIDQAPPYLLIGLIVLIRVVVMRWADDGAGRDRLRILPNVWPCISRRTYRVGPACGG